MCIWFFWNVVRVAIDSGKENLSQSVYEVGYNKHLKTLFTWEGVTMFIPAEAVDETLAFLARSSGEGGSIIFDYILKSVVDGTCEFKEAEKWRRTAERVGKACTFGIEEGTVGGFLPGRELHMISVAIC